MEQGLVLPSNHALSEEDIDYIWTTAEGFLPVNDHTKAENLFLIPVEGHARGSHEQDRADPDSRHLEEDRRTGGTDLRRTADAI